MSKYRIVQVGNNFHIDQRFWFIWCRVSSIAFNSIRDAKEAIDFLKIESIKSVVYEE